MKIERILLPTDFSACANQALGLALFLAEQHGAELHLLHVVELHDEDPFNPAYHFPNRDEIFRRLHEIAASEMRDLVPRSDTRRVRLEIHEHRLRAVAAGPAILEFADQQGIDLIVMGAHGRRGLRRFLLGSVAEEVVRLAPCPVLTVRESETEPRLRRTRRILVPIDFSEHSRGALEAAKELAAIYGGELDLLHVVEVPVYPSYYDAIVVEGRQYGLPEIAVEARSELEQLMAETDGPAVPFRVEIVEGIAAASILSFAQKAESDLIVMATHGLTGIQHFLLGSVTEKIVRAAKCPVLTVKPAALPDDFEQAVAVHGTTALQAG